MKDFFVPKDLLLFSNSMGINSDFSVRGFSVGEAEDDGTLTVTAVVGDPYWSNVALLIQPAQDAVDGSTAITDATGKTVTIIGNTQIDTSLGSPTILFDGNGDYLTIPDADEFDLSSGDFTLDIIGIVPAATRADFLGHRASLTDWGWISIINDGVLNFAQWTSPGKTYNYASQSLPSAGQIFAARITRSGNDLTVAINGVAGTTLTTTNRPGANTAAITIGRQFASYTSYQFAGHIRAIRLTSGVARSLSEIPAYPFPTS